VWGGGVKYIAQVNACEKQIFGLTGSVLEKWDKRGRKRERGEYCIYALHGVVEAAV
jgi:hypothetical protein